MADTTSTPAPPAAAAALVITASTKAENEADSQQTTSLPPEPAPVVAQPAPVPELSTPPVAKPEAEPAVTPAESTAQTTEIQTVSTPAEATVAPATTPPATDMAEPQNPLTQKFTDAEWKALKELRSQLPDIFADAYADDPNAKNTPVTLWGVTIDPKDPAKDARVSVVLVKFLRARHLSVRDGRDMLVNTLRWRESFNLKSACEEIFPEEVFGNLGHVYGKDKDGRPVVYNIYGGNQDLKAVFGDVQRFIRWRVALMEKSVAELDFVNVDQTLQIHDYEGVSMSSRDANSKAAAKEATNIFQSHYPELLYRKFFVNVPSLLTWIFWAFKPILSAETLAKMSVVGTGSHTINKALIPYIDADQLPDKYGGDAYHAFEKSK